MRNKNFKGRCTKITLKKSKEVCRTFDPIQYAYAIELEQNPNISEIRCNVVLDGLEIGDYMSDFVCIKSDGDLMVRECVHRKLLERPSTLKLLDASQKFWYRHGVMDWGVVCDE